MEAKVLQCRAQTILHTRAFNLSEVNLLRKTLEIKFNLKTNIIEKVPNQ
jgi:hypothetical protein